MKTNYGVIFNTYVKFKVNAIKFLGQAVRFVSLVRSANSCTQRCMPSKTVGKIICKVETVRMMLKSGLRTLTFTLNLCMLLELAIQMAN